MRIRPLETGDWPAVRSIYEAGIATGDATFETRAPDWAAWDAAHLPRCRLVADDGAILGWAALSAVSDRCVYGGVAEVSVYVDPAHQGRGVGTALWPARGATCCSWSGGARRSAPDRTGSSSLDFSGLGLSGADQVWHARCRGSTEHGFTARGTHGTRPHGSRLRGPRPHGPTAHGSRLRGARPHGPRPTAHGPRPHGPTAPRHTATRQHGARHGMQVARWVC